MEGLKDRNLTRASGPLAAKPQAFIWTDGTKKRDLEARGFWLIRRWYNLGSSGNPTEGFLFLIHTPVAGIFSQLTLTTT